MPITIRCEGCNQRYAAPDHLAGSKLACKRCGRLIEVPPAGVTLGTAADPPVKPALPPVRTPAPRDDRPAAIQATVLSQQPPLSNHSRGISPLAWIGIGAGAGVVVLLLMVALLVVAAGRGGRRRLDVTRHTTGEPASSAPSRTTAVQPPSSRRSSQPPRASVKNDNEKAKGKTIAWSVRRDPMATPVEFPASGNFEVSVLSGCKVVYPATPSPFVLLAHQTDVFNVIDLRTGKSAGRLSKKGSLYGAALSPDGQLIAGSSEIVQKTLQVFSLDGQVVREVTGKGRIQTAAFTRPDRLALVDSDGGKERLFVIDVASGKEICRIPYKLQGSVLPVSPGGRYAATFDRNTLTVYDLDDGSTAGQLALADSQKSWQANGISFSADGSELAAMFAASPNPRLVCWDVVGGSVVLDTLLEQHGKSPMMTVYKGAAVQWLPDKSLLLVYNHLFLDHKTGKPVWQLPPATSQPRKLLDANRLVDVGRNSIHGDLLTVIDVPGEKIAAALSAIEKGGRAIDASLPPLTHADLSKVRTLSFPTGEVRWSFKPAAAATSDIKPQPIPLIAREVVAGRFSRDGGTLACVYNPQSVPREGTLQDNYTGRAIKALAMPGGTENCTIDLAVGYRLMDVSPKGETALGLISTENAQRDRLDAWSLKTGKHIAAWRPYDDQPEDKNREVVWAAFADAQHALTLNAGKKLVLWSLPDCRAVYALPEVDRVLALSPDGGSLCVGSSAAKALGLLDAVGGQWRGWLTLPDAKPISAMAFSRDGSRLATLSHDTFCEWDLVAGRLRNKLIGTQRSASEMVWCDERYLLADNRYLFDKSSGMVAWEYEFTGRLLDNSPDGRLWFVAPAQGSSGPTILHAAALPTPAVGDLFRGKRLEEAAILYPGCKASLTINIPADVQKAKESLAKRLQENGVTVASSAPVRIVLTCKDRETGKQLQVIGGKRFAEREMVCDLLIADDRGREFKLQQVLPRRSKEMISEIDVGKGTVEEALRKELAGRATEFALSLPLKKYVFPDNKSPRGVSRLTPQGEIPLSTPAAGGIE